jgi:phospholipid/cholesterol/gamma-HCH transport system substrate-binding protein
MPQALKILADNRSQLTTMLVSLQHLGDVAVRVENASQADMVGNLHDLQPTLEKLAEAGTNISKALEVLFTFPVASGSYRDVYKGDYTNIGITLDFRLQSLRHNYGLDGSSGGTSGSAGSGTLPIPGLPSLPSLPKLPSSGSSSGTTSPKPSSSSLPLPKLPLGPASAGQAATVTEVATPDNGEYGSDIAKLLLEVFQ